VFDSRHAVLRDGPAGSGRPMALCHRQARQYPVRLASFNQEEVT
jgi:hypothetical protein